MSAQLAREMPIAHVSENKRISCRAKMEYYENKIRCLAEMNLPLNLILMACWDAPVEKTNIHTAWGRKKVIKKCLKYYKGQLKILTKQEKKFAR